MSEIFREIDEEVRRDQLLQLWKRYRLFIIGGLVFLVAGLAGWNLWQDSQRRAREAESAELTRAVEMLALGEFTAGREALAELEQDAGAGYALLARLERAASLVEAGDKLAAIDVYDSIATDGRLERRHRELGDLLAAFLLVDLANSDAVRARLQPLAVDDGAWRFSAWDLLALLDFSDGDTVAAAETYRRLVADPETPPALRQRATDMLDLIETSGLESGGLLAPVEEGGDAADGLADGGEGEDSPDDGGSP